tara:strand:- start:327 stop:680 length:354 start_codon:yes stop_codon:yes gene_type:complete
MDFEYIQQFHLNPPTFALKRTKYMEDKYQASKRKCENYEEDLYSRLFPNPESIWCILPNEYPYHFKDMTRHYLIWYKGDLGFDYFKNALDQIEAVYFENIPSNKSIKSINHIHLFLR